MADPGITFAIISTAPAAPALLDIVCKELEEKTELHITPVVLRAYDKLVEQMRDGSVQLAWAPPLVALDLERDASATIRLYSRRAGRRDYMSVLFVPRASPIATLADLAGKRVGWVAPESSAGYVFPRLKLAAAGFDPDTLFSEQTFWRTHEAVTRAVLAGRVDVGATYASFVDGQAAPVSAGWLEGGAAKGDVRVLAAAGPIPADVIAMGAGLDASTKDRIATALKELGAPVRQLLNADGFGDADDSHLDALRDIVAAARAKLA